MKRWTILLIVALLLAACGGDDEPTPQNTLEPTPTPTPTETLTPTPYVRPTLPPEQTLSAATESAPRATRTPPPSLTPAPSATSNLNPDVTPFEMLAPSATPGRLQPESGGLLTLLVSYPELGEALRGGDIPSATDDQVSMDSQDIFWEEESPQVSFLIMEAGDSPAFTVKAPLAFTANPETGRFEIALGPSSVDGDPENIYQGQDVLAQFPALIQTALEDVVAKIAFYEGYQGQLVAVDATVNSDGVVLTLTPAEAD